MWREGCPQKRLAKGNTRFVSFNPTSRSEKRVECSDANDRNYSGACTGFDELLQNVGHAFGACFCFESMLGGTRGTLDCLCNGSWNDRQQQYLGRFRQVSQEQEPGHLTASQKHQVRFHAKLLPQLHGTRSCHCHFPGGASNVPLTSLKGPGAASFPSC